MLLEQVMLSPNQSDLKIIFFKGNGNKREKA